LDETNRVLDDTRLVRGYLHALTTTDSTDATAQSLLTQVQTDVARLTTLRTRLARWAADHDLDGVLARSGQAADHEFALRRAAVLAHHQMAPGEEALANDLSLIGSNAWYRLYSDLTSSITGVVDLPDRGPSSMGIFAIRGLATHPSRDVRAAAFNAELECWRSNEIAIAGALNAIKGETITLNDRRGWTDDLEPALATNNVEREVLDAMNVAVTESLPDFRRYLHAKARLLGVDRLAFWDLFAPTGEVSPTTWVAAVASVRDRFATYSPRLASLVDRAVSESWLDVAPRPGKVGGAFCMSVRDDESRVLLNFDGSADGVQTLAHELGHAYHNTQLAHRTALQRGTPMALAETASIFCETLTVDAGLAATIGDERLALLDVDLTGACQVVVDIRSRFLFESRLFDARRRSTLSAADLCDLMAETQVEAYGDGLGPEALHPYMWAAKPHYYGSSFYNWPYTYGLLFGIGLFARYREDPASFREGYDDLLSTTGMSSARDLAARFEIDVGSPDFWRSSLAVLCARIDEFESLVDERS
ncbi:MAG TPA: M3 family oligoendopeptidase, partial [Acidimicrobiales bacterium]